MRYSGIQPQYFPRLHYMARIINADVFMVRDEAQFVRKHKYPDGKNGKSYQADSPVKQATGTMFLSVPIRHKEERFLPISKTEISYDSNWIQNHLATLKTSYSRAKYFQEIYPTVEFLLNRRYETVADLNISTILWGMLVLLKKDISKETLTLSFINSKLKSQKEFRLKEIRLSSHSKSISLFKDMNANEKIVALIKETGADEDYCGGTGIAAYVNHSLFEKNGIKITIQDWKCRAYPQLFTDKLGFIPNLSILDLLFNVSAFSAREILLG